MREKKREPLLHQPFDEVVKQDHITDPRLLLLDKVPTTDKVIENHQCVKFVL
jgi:hypothetical protein